MKEVYKKIESLSKRDVADAKGLTLKAMEELGELVQALLHENGYKPNNKSKKAIKENQLEECADVIVCIFGVAQKLGFTYKDVVDMMIKKSGKWEKVLEKRKWNS
jgi:NTP pyrophosphatase (non-canonical NTP hydrolase)